jgi:rare lipoprotein A
MLKRAAANGAASDSIFCRPYEVTPRSAFVLWRNGTNGTFRSIQDFAGRNRTGGQAIVAPRIAGGGKTASLPIYRRIQTGKHRPLKSGRQNGVVPQRKEAVVKGRMMLFVVSILAYQFSPPLLTPSAANQTGVASVYSHESGSGTASGQKLNREAFTAAHRTLPFGTKVKVTNKSNGRSVVVTINDRGPFVRGRVIDVTPAAARVLGFSGLTQVALDAGQ